MQDKWIKETGSTGIDPREGTRNIVFHWNWTKFSEAEIEERWKKQT